MMRMFRMGQLFSPEAAFSSSSLLFLRLVFLVVLVLFASCVFRGR